MSVCTFFGHRECYGINKDILRIQIEKLITQSDVTMFYVGQEGYFDSVVYQTLKDLKFKYPFISYVVVLAYLPKHNMPFDFSETLLPEGIENIHPKYALSWRNRWMLRQADYVITYITHDWGGAAKFAGMAIKQGKTVLNIAELESLT